MNKIEFKNLPNTTTPLNAENLNTMQDNIEAEFNNKADIINITTGTEYETGRIIDGKKEYGKKINIGALPNATVKYVATGLSNVKVVDYSGMAFSSSSQRKIPFSSGQNYVDIYFNAAGGTITINTNYDYSSYSEAYLDVHYTKNS